MTHSSEPEFPADEKSTSADFEVKVFSRKQRIGAAHLVIVVICSLVYGALVYVSRFSPQIAGIQTIYPPAAVSAPFGVWFGVWGALGNALGNLVSAILVGRSPLPWLLAYIAQIVMAIIPSVLYRKNTISSWQNFLHFEAANAVGLSSGATLVALQLQLNGSVPANLVWKVVWPAMLISGLLSGLILAPLLMRLVGPYIDRIGLVTNTRSAKTR